MTTTRIGLVTLTLLWSGLALAQQPPGAAVGPPPTLPSVPGGAVEPPAPKTGPYVRVPANATLVGDVRSADGGIDERMFRSDLPFDAAVQFYDRDFQQRGTQILSRRVEPDGVAYRVRRPDGQTARVTVRSTKPTLIDVRERL